MHRCLCLQAKGVRVVAVGIGPRIHKSELIEIAMGQERMVVQVANFDQLKNKIDEVLQDSCNGNLYFTMIVVWQFKAFLLL